MSEEHFRGYISTEHTVWCGRCDVWDQLAEHTLKGTIQEVQKAGWRRSRKYGWLCPDCVKEVAQGVKEPGWRSAK